MKGYGVGGLQSGIRLNASCSPFDVIPPSQYDAFKRAVMARAAEWGLSVHFGQDDGTIEQAKQRFYRMPQDAGPKQDE